ncbi:hypothetical protein D3C87_1266220 [compost metagenome]
MAIIGIKLTIGPGASASPNHPHWKTATSAPNIASTDNKKPSVALIGTRIDRNAIISNTNDKPTTTARYIGRASDNFLLISDSSAVVPVIPMLTF